MSSLFNNTGGKSKTPPWCITLPFEKPPLYVDGLPTSLVAFCRWSEPPIEISITESFQISKDVELPGWSGASSDFGDNLQVKVRILPEPNHYHLTITLRQGTQGIHTHGWTDVFIQEPPPFDSGALWLYDPPDQATLELALLD